MSSQGKMQGKVALISGGNSGIGLATATLLKAEGAHVAIMGRDNATLAEAVRALGGDSLGFAGEVQTTADLDRFVQKTVEAFGRIDFVFANAGIVINKPMEEITEEDWDSVQNINVKGVFFLIQKALPFMKAGSSVVVTGSVVGERGMPGSAAYAASKAAVRAIVRVLATELAPRRIRVNAISPGPTETPILGRNRPSEAELAMLKTRLEASIPLGRMGRPDETAKGVLFLASEDSSFTTGAEFPIDGGMNQI